MNHDQDRADIFCGRLGKNIPIPPRPPSPQRVPQGTGLGHVRPEGISKVNQSVHSELATRDEPRQIKPKPSRFGVVSRERQSRVNERATGERGVRHESDDPGGYHPSALGNPRGKLPPQKRTFPEY